VAGVAPGDRIMNRQDKLAGLPPFFALLTARRF